MFDIESKNPDEITINTKKTSVTFNFVENTIDAGLAVGKIEGPGEFEIGDVTIRGIDVDAVVAAAAKEEKKEGEDSAAAVKGSPAMVNSGRTIYDVLVGDVHVGIIGDSEAALDELGVANVLCTSSVRAVREVEPKVVIATGNIDGMVTELKLSAKTEKKYKVKSLDALPATLEVVALS